MLLQVLNASKLIPKPVFGQGSGPDPAGEAY